MQHMMEMAATQKANELVQQAAADVQAAHAVLPNLPFTATAELQSARAGVFQARTRPPRSCSARSWCTRGRLVHSARPPPGPPPPPPPPLMCRTSCLVG